MIRCFTGVKEVAIQYIGRGLAKVSRVFALTMRQNLEDFARDLSTRLEGAGELLRNFAILSLGISSRPTKHNYNGQVLHEWISLLCISKGHR